MGAIGCDFHKKEKSPRKTLTKNIFCAKINGYYRRSSRNLSKTVGGGRSGESPMECRRCKATRRRISQAKGQSRKTTIAIFLFLP